MKKITFLINFIIFSLLILINNTIVLAFEKNNYFYLPSLATMLEKIMPSVVSINVEGNTVTHSQKFPPQFQPFFGNNSPFCQEGSPFYNSPLCQGPLEDFDQQKKFHALGSGVIIHSEKGYIVTNNHVVEHANKIQVQIHDGRKYEAHVIGQDARSDLAVIQIKNFKNIVSIKLADSDFLRVGDYAVAIGNPYGLGETVTSGIISALGRSGLNSENYENFIQTDAAINRGNSGGALVNLHGELIGINTAILAPNGGNIGIGFAIPSNMVKNLSYQMIEYGKIKRGELGIMGIELTPELAKAIKIDMQRGAFVSQVLPNSSASKAGMQPGDVIITINNKPISSFSALRAQISTFPIGSKIQLGILREEKNINIVIELEEKKNNNDITNEHDKNILEQNNVNLIEGALLSNYDNQNIKGVKVDSIKKNSTAEHMHLQKNDIIISVNQELIKNINELKKIFSSNPQIIVLKILRGNEYLYLLMP